MAASCAAALIYRFPTTLPEGSMGGKFAIAAMQAALMSVAAASQPLMAQTAPEATKPPPVQAPNVPSTPGSEGAGSPSVTVLDTRQVQGILGSEIRSAADENMGRIVDVIVDVDGQIRAAIIDFGGFLGVGSRKIAVDWKALRFVPTASKRYRVSLELTRDQVKPAPEYKEGKPVVVLGPAGSLEPLP